MFRPLIRETLLQLPYRALNLLFIEVDPKRKNFLIHVDLRFGRDLLRQQLGQRIANVNLDSGIVLPLLR